jgi:nucleoside-diphosphate-sugar epimerase
VPLNRAKPTANGQNAELPNSGIVLVAGATGKVGRVFIKRLLAEPKFNSFTIRALNHPRELEPHPRLENMRGSIAYREVVEKAMAGVTHVVHPPLPMTQQAERRSWWV